MFRSFATASLLARIGLFGLILLSSCTSEIPTQTDVNPPNETVSSESGSPEPDSTEPGSTGPDATPVVTLGAGCFWCVEAVLEQVDGIESVESGYMGGHVPNPTYEEVCGKKTGHAEVVQVRYDPSKISFDSLIRWFWQAHDPTTLNRQGNDVGPQYRSAIFYHSEAQRLAAEASKQAAQEGFDDPIVTEISPASEFYVAEDYHQDFYRNNRANQYCRYIIAPKLDKLGLEK